MIGTTNTGINHTIFFEYWDICSKKVKDFDAEVSEIVKSGNAANFRERVIREDVVIKSLWKFKSLLHHAVTCKGENKIEMISAVLQSSMENINHQDEDDNTPLMYLLSEAQEKGKYTKEDLEKIIRFLVERGASFEMRNNEGTTADDLKTVLISEGILDDGINEIIDEAKTSSSLPNRIKAQLSKHITNNGNPIIQEVAVYGNYAQINLNSDGAELKISEFLQGDFCKDNGISGFSTFHNDDKSGMHGFLSPNGVRNYTVTDGSYDMTLDWVVGGKKCTITINISKDGVVVIDENGVVMEDSNGLTDEQLKANEYVTINGLSLFDAINKGRNREQNIRQENMQGADEVDSNAPKVKEQIRVREAPLQRNVQQQKSTDEKGIPLKKLQYQQEETNPKVVDWVRGDTGSGVVSAPIGQLDGQDESFNVDDSVTIRLLSESEFQAKVKPKKTSTPKRTEQSDPQDTSSESIDGGKNTPEFIEYEQYYNNLMANSRNRDDLQNTSPKSLDWPDGNTESDSGYSSPTGNKGIGDQGTLQESESELKRRFAQLNMGLKSPGTSNSQTEQSDPQDTSPKLTEQSDSRNTDPKSLGQSAKSPYSWVYGQSGSSSTSIESDSASYISDDSEDGFLGSFGRNGGKKSAQLSTSTETELDVYSSFTGNKGIGDQSTLQEFESELKGRFAQPNMGLKSLSASNSQTEQSDSGYSSPATDRNLTIFDPKELDAKLDSVKQKQGVKQPSDHISGQIQKGSRYNPIRKFLENKEGTSVQVADDNGLGKMQGHSGTSKFENKLSQKELATSQQLIEKDFSILNLSEEESGLKPADRSKMTKQTLEYLYGADEPTHKQEGPHASRVRANRSQGNGGCSRG